MFCWCPSVFPCRHPHWQWYRNAKSKGSCYRGSGGENWLTSINQRGGIWQYEEKQLLLDRNWHWNFCEETHNAFWEFQSIIPCILNGTYIWIYFTRDSLIVKDFIRSMRLWHTLILLEKKSTVFKGQVIFNRFYENHVISQAQVALKSSTLIENQWLWRVQLLFELQEMSRESFW